MRNFGKQAARAFVMAVVLTSAASVQAQDYPARPIKLVVPFPPGGGTDIVTRHIAGKLSEVWKVPVIVDNRPGGNTIIGAEMAAKAAPDGYTLFAPIDSTLAMNPSLYAKLPYDPVGSFAPITLAISMPMVLAVHPSVEARSVNDLIVQVRAAAGRMPYAHGALPAQVAGEVFKSAAKVEMPAVAYKGGAPAMLDVVGGSVPVIFDALGPAMPFLKDGRVRPLAVTSRQRSPLLPNVPTLAESGMPDVDLVTWIGYAAPAGTPRDIIAKLNAEFVRILNLPETRERLSGLGMQVVGSSPEQFAETIRVDTARLGRVIRAAGIRLD